MRGKVAVISGGAGFIGRNTIVPLLEKGYEIHVFDVKSLEDEYQNVNWQIVNINDFKLVNDLMEKIKPTHLLNFAWVTKHRDYWTSEENIECINASFNLLRTFKNFGGKRFVMSGSCAEYDWSNGGLCSEDMSPLRPNTFYGSCKEAMWQIVRNYSRLNNLSYSWGRIFFTFGPYENPDRLVSYVITSLLANRPAMCSHGWQIRDFMSTIEIGKAFAELLDCNVDGAVNVASGNKASLRDVVSIIGKEIGREHLIELGAIEANKSDPEMIVANVDRLNKEVGWKCTTPLKEQLKDTISWWKEKLQLVNFDYLDMS